METALEQIMKSLDKKLDELTDALIKLSKNFRFNSIITLIGVLIISLHVIGCSAQDKDVISLDLSSEVLIPKKYVIYKTSDVFTIDGQANEEDWNAAPFSDYYIDIEGIKKPKYNTRMKMLWGKQYLYIYAELEEPQLSANLTKHDTVMFYDNDFEVFIDHNDDTYQYVEFGNQCKQYNLGSLSGSTVSIGRGGAG